MAMPKKILQTKKNRLERLVLTAHLVPIQQAGCTLPSNHASKDKH